MSIDKELITKLSNKAMISLSNVELEVILADMISFEEAMSELYNIDTSRFSLEDEVSETLDILSLRDDI